MRKILVLMGVAVLMATPASAQLVTTLCDVNLGNVIIGTEVWIDSLVVQAIDVKPTTYGLYCQEANGCPGYANGEWSGALVYMGADYPEVVVGDLISVSGTYEEYNDLTEIDNVTNETVTLIQAGYGQIPPVPLTTADLGLWAADTLCEKWETVLIRLDTLVCTGYYNMPDYPEANLVEKEDFTGLGKAITDTIRVDDKLAIPTLAYPAPGDSLEYIIGMWNSANYVGTTEYNIIPQGNEDIVYLGDPPPPDLIQAYSVSGTRVIANFDREVSAATAADPANFTFLTVSVTSSVRHSADYRKVYINHTAAAPETPEQLLVCNLENADGIPMSECQTFDFWIGVNPISFVQTPGAGDTSQVIGEVVTIAGQVTGGSEIFTHFYIGTPGGGPYNGLYIYGTDARPSTGDSLIIAGIVAEYYGSTQIYAPMYVSSPIFCLTPDMQPDVLDISVLTTPSPGDTADVWENCLVRVEDTAVSTAEYGFNVSSGGDTCLVGYYGDYNYYAHTGDSVSVTGLLQYNYDVWTLQPRTDADIDTLFLADVPIENLPLRVVEFKNYPNPFNPETTIEFGIDSHAQVDLSIFDVQGRLVRTLIHQPMATGSYRVRWNGENSMGQATAAGIYYCRLQAGERVERKKLVLVK